MVNSGIQLDFVSVLCESNHLQVLFAELFKLPPISFERLRREHTTDVIYGEIKTIADLGIKLTEVEERFPFEFKYYRSQYFNDAVNFRLPPVEPPPAIKI